MPHLDTEHTQKEEQPTTPPVDTALHRRALLSVGTLTIFTTILCVVAFITVKPTPIEQTPPVREYTQPQRQSWKKLSEKELFNQKIVSDLIRKRADKWYENNGTYPSYCQLVTNTYSVRLELDGVVCTNIIDETVQPRTGSAAVLALITPSDTLGEAPPSYSKVAYVNCKSAYAITLWNSDLGQYDTLVLPDETSKCEQVIPHTAPPSKVQILLPQRNL